MPYTRPSKNVGCLSGISLRPTGGAGLSLASCAPQVPTRVLRLPDVIARVGLKRASIYLHIGKGTFPKPIALGPRAVGWLEHEIDEWLAARVQMRGGGKHAFSGSSAALETAVEDIGSRDI